MKKDKEQRKQYEAPVTTRTAVELESGFMSASILHEDSGHDKGLKTEEHGFANPETDFEGDYGEGPWD